MAHSGSTELRARECSEKKDLGTPPAAGLSVLRLLRWPEPDGFAQDRFRLPPICSSSGAASGKRSGAAGSASAAADAMAASMDAARRTLRGGGQNNICRELGCSCWSSLCG